MLVLRFLISIQLSKMLRSLLEILISISILNYLPWLLSKRSKNHKIPNNSKFDKATDFISLVENEIKSNKLSSIDETINYLIIHQRDKINDMETVSTKTFYNYVHQGKTSIKPIDLPRMVRRKQRRTGRHIFLKDKKGFLLLKGLNLSIPEKRLVIGRAIWLLALEMVKWCLSYFVGKKNSILLYDPYFFQIF